MRPHSLHILHITRRFGSGGGVETYLSRLLTASEGGDLRHTVICGEWQPRDATFASHIRLFSEFPRDPWEQLSHSGGSALRRLIGELAPDVLHLHDCPLWQIVRAVSSLNIPIVATVHSHDFVCPGGTRFHRRRAQICTIHPGWGCLVYTYSQSCNNRHPHRAFGGLQRVIQNRKAAEKISHFIVASQYMKNELCGVGIDAARVRVNPYFVSLPLEPRHLMVAGKLLFIGRVSDLKGLDYLLKALPTISPPHHLVVVGDGYSMAQARKCATSLGLNERVTFTGWLVGDELTRHLEEAAIVIVPSLWPEPFGIAGIEAMAYGRPVVAFDVGGISEWLQHERTGYLVPPYDIREMGRRIDFLLRNPPLASQMGKAGREVVKRQFLPEYHLKQLLEVYNCSLR